MFGNKYQPKKEHGSSGGNFVVFLIKYERLDIQTIRHKGHISEPN